MSYRKPVTKQYVQKRKPIPKTMYVSALVFDAPELTLAKVEVLKIKRKYAIIRHKSKEYEIPKNWLVKNLGEKSATA